MARLAPDLAALKATTRALIDACGGSEACAVVLEKSASLIRSYANPNVADRFMPLDDVMALERVASRPVICAWGVERHRSNPDRKPRRLSPATDLPRMIKESTDANLAYLDAFSDGKLCAADRLKLGRELREAAALFAELADAVEESE